MRIWNLKVTIPKSVATLLLLMGTTAWGAPLFQKDEAGMIRPSKVKNMPLYEFVREYSKAMDVPIEVGGRWEDELKGSTTLFIHRPMKPEALTELFHQVLYDNRYTAIDAPGKKGWIIRRGRDARDDVLPIYDSTNFPESSRIMTVIHNLKHAPAEHIARHMRSFMPANSRIIPSFSQILITDTGRNIKKMMEIVALLDVPAAEKVFRSDKHLKAKECKEREQKIEKLTIEKLEVKEMPSMPPQLSTTSQPQSKMPVGGKK